jgi:hypothetical protein
MSGKPFPRPPRRDSGEPHAASRCRQTPRAARFEVPRGQRPPSGFGDEQPVDGESPLSRAHGSPLCDREPVAHQFPQRSDCEAVRHHDRLGAATGEPASIRSASRCSTGMLAPLHDSTAVRGRRRGDAQGNPSAPPLGATRGSRTQRHDAGKSREPQARARFSAPEAPRWRSTAERGGGVAKLVRIEKAGRDSEPVPEICTGR